MKGCQLSATQQVRQLSSWPLSRTLSRTLADYPRCATRCTPVSTVWQASLSSALQPGNSEGCRQEAARALSNLSCNNDVNQVSIAG